MKKQIIANGPRGIFFLFLTYELNSFLHFSPRGVSSFINIIKPKWGISRAPSSKSCTHFLNVLLVMVKEIGKRVTDRLTHMNSGRLFQIGIVAAMVVLVYFLVTMSIQWLFAYIYFLFDSIIYSSCLAPSNGLKRYLCNIFHKSFRFNRNYLLGKEIKMDRRTKMDNIFLECIQKSFTTSLLLNVKKVFKIDSVKKLASFGNV